MVHPVLSLSQVRYTTILSVQITAEARHSIMVNKHVPVMYYNRTWRPKILCAVDDGSSWYHTFENFWYSSDGVKMDYNGHDSSFERNLVVVNAYGVWINFADNSHSSEFVHFV